MNLLAIVLYNHRGQRRVVDFVPGQLNIVTGWSATGKSALLDITEFCLGRDTVTMPVGPITDTVSWYAVLVQLPTTRAFIARPAPRPGRASTQQAMLEFGADLEPLDFDDLGVNTDSDTLRHQLGRHIGIGENLHEPGPGSLRSPLEAHLGHALLLCLQRQGEIGNRDLLFHRQGEPGIRQAIIDTLPYFLGAVPADQALLRQQLQQARRHLRRLEADLSSAEKLDNDMDVEMRALLNEARTHGLLDLGPDPQGREEALAVLNDALALSSQPAEDGGNDDARRRELQRHRDALRSDLRSLNEHRALLEAQEDGENGYRQAVNTGVSRLNSLDLVRHNDDPGTAQDCPLCGSALPEPDPTLTQLHQTLADLRSQLRSVEAASPRRVAALAELDARSDSVREELRGVEATLTGLRAADATLVRTHTERQAFTKGRIDLYLTRLRRVGNEHDLNDLRSRVDLARRDVERLTGALDADEEREQVTSRLLAVAKDMTRWADTLDLEHRGSTVRLDPHRLTVVADTDTGPAPLFRIGSGENWVSYHLIAHLALHRYFVRQHRPVPHLLMLDQPTQAYYPSEVEQREGVPHLDDDRAAVRRLFELIRDVAHELAPHLQIIVCDHANLEEPWFQDAVQHNWRGEALIPADWLPGASSPTDGDDQ